jgi:hypothetical protein
VLSAVDRLTWSFEYDQILLPDLASGEPVRAVFPCAACPEPAGGLVHVPPGTAFPGVDEGEDDPNTARLGVWFRGSVELFLEMDGVLFDEVRHAIVTEDVAAIAEHFPDWAPFWCAACQASYCVRHWLGTPGSCPAGHASQTVL